MSIITCEKVLIIMTIYINKFQHYKNIKKNKTIDFFCEKNNLIILSRVKKSLVKKKQSDIRLNFLKNNYL